MTKQKTISIKDIAKKAGVSTATVSRVINQNGRFSTETEKRVLKIIKEMGYTPNESAKSLRTSKAKVVGILVPDITNPYFTSLTLKLQMALSKASYSCQICNTNEHQDILKKHLQLLVAKNVSGVIVLSGQRNYSEIEDIPTVYVDRSSEKESPNKVSIYSDNETGGYLVAKELLDCGCQSIAVLMWKEEEDYNQRARYNGFLKAVEESGRQVSSETIVCPSASIEMARTTLSQLFNEGKLDHIDGIMATTDTMAVGALLALREHRIKVPEEVKLTGFDDSIISQTSMPTITTIHQDMDQMSSLAVGNLLKMMNGEKIDHIHHVLPVTLIKRESTS